MGKKYIVEIGRLERLYKASINELGKPELNWLAPAVDISSYTEPDTEQIRKEAYEEGYKEGMQLSIDDAKLKEEYQQGLNDAWEAAKKIALMDTETSENVTGYFGLFNIMNNLTASEAIAKIKEYEDDKQEIKVGDEVVGIFSDGNETRPFVFIRGSQEYYFGLYSDTGEFCQGGMNLRKTGRSFPEIAAVLEKMRGKQE